jgi:hypothetical protein
MNRFIDTKIVGFAALFAQALALVPTGFYLFGIATIVLYQNEARTDWGDMVSKTVVGPASPDSAFDGVDMTVTGALTADREIGDPIFFEPGPFVTVVRSVETYAWVERVDQSVERRWGGSAEVTTETTYHLAYVVEPDGNRGAYYYGGANPAAPQLGDTRMTFHVVPSGVTMTAVGYGAGETIGGLDWFKGVELVPVLPGSRQDVVGFMGGLFQITRWLGRIGGTIAVFFGLWLLIGPLFAVFDIAPPVGLAARVVAGIFVVPAAIAWSGLVMIVSQILHSWVMLTILAFLLYLWVRTAVDRRRERRANDRARAFRAARGGGSPLA